MVCGHVPHGGSDYVSFSRRTDMLLQCRLPESGQRLSDIAQTGDVQSRGLLALTLAILQARQTLTFSFTKCP